MGCESPASKWHLGGDSLGALKRSYLKELQEIDRGDPAPTRGHNPDYYNINDLYQISDNPRVRPRLRRKHCWFEQGMKHDGKLYALVTIIRGGGNDDLQWLIRHEHLQNISFESRHWDD